MSDFREIRVIDCTLRDGAYRLPQGFTAGETARLAAGLEATGIPVVELGHGLGLGAPVRGLAPCGDSDEAYLRAGRGALGRARMAALAIPGIAAPDDLRRAAYLGLDVLRIGIDVLRAEEAAPYLAEGRRLGLETHASLLKASMTDPEGFARQAARMAEAGAQHIGLYDSAGALLPGQVAAMLQAARAEVAVGLAFHGHNNLGLAVANSLAAVAAGAATVDCTLRGVGRSAGNAATETFLLAARRAGLAVAGDFAALGRMSQAEILPRFGPVEGSPEDAGMGFAGLHSDGLVLVREVAAARRIDPLTLLLALAARPPVARLTRQAVEEAAAPLPSAPVSVTASLVAAGPA
jgi:4-hydroxy-2-oxovalerate aldolase